MSTLEALAERVDRLLVRHAEARRTNALLLQQVAALTQERDGLKSRLSAARQRLDGLLDKLPAEAASMPPPAAPEVSRGGVPHRIEPTLSATPDGDAVPRPAVGKQLR